MQGTRHSTLPFTFDGLGQVYENLRNLEWEKHGHTPTSLTEIHDKIAPQALPNSSNHSTGLAQALPLASQLKGVVQQQSSHEQQYNQSKQDHRQLMTQAITNTVSLPPAIYEKTNSQMFSVNPPQKVPLKDQLHRSLENRSQPIYMYQVSSMKHAQVTTQQSSTQTCSQDTFLINKAKSVNSTHMSQSHSSLVNNPVSRQFHQDTCPKPFRFDLSVSSPDSVQQSSSQDTFSVNQPKSLNSKYMSQSHSSLVNGPASRQFHQSTCRGPLNFNLSNGSLDSVEQSSQRVQDHQPQQTVKNSQFHCPNETVQILAVESAKLDTLKVSQLQNGQDKHLEQNQYEQQDRPAQPKQPAKDFGTDSREEETTEITSIPLPCGEMQTTSENQVSVSQHNFQQKCQVTQAKWTNEQQDIQETPHIQAGHAIHRMKRAKENKYLKTYSRQNARKPTSNLILERLKSRSSNILSDQISNSTLGQGSQEHSIHHTLVTTEVSDFCLNKALSLNLTPPTTPPSDNTSAKMCSKKNSANIFLKNSKSCGNSNSQDTCKKSRMDSGKQSDCDYVLLTKQIRNIPATDNMNSSNVKQPCNTSIGNVFSSECAGTLEEFTNSLNNKSFSELCGIPKPPGSLPKNFNEVKADIVFSEPESRSNTTQRETDMDEDIQIVFSKSDSDRLNMKEDISSLGLRLFPHPNSGTEYSCNSTLLSTSTTSSMPLPSTRPSTTIVHSTSTPCEFIVPSTSATQIPTTMPFLSTLSSTSIMPASTMPSSTIRTSTTPTSTTPTSTTPTSTTPTSTTPTSTTPTSTTSTTSTSTTSTSTTPTSTTPTSTTPTSTTPTSTTPTSTAPVSITMASKSILQGSHDLMDNSLKSLTSDQKEIQISDNLLESPEVYCYVCDNNVSGKDITSHLYFGRLSCTSCPAEIVSCDMMNLSEKPLFMGLCHSGQDHSFQNWPHDLNKFLTYNIQKDLLIRRFCEDIHTVLTNEELKEEVEQYISKLDVLLPYPPWRSALHQIKYMHHETKFHPTVNLTEEKESSPGNTSYLDDNVNLKDLTSYSPLPKPPKFLRKSSRLRGPCIVNTPVDGRYLVVKYPSQSCPESCPECYTVICPSKFSLNITNFTISYVCEYCYLVIYFIPNPVEGFDSNIGFKNERIGLKNANPKSRKLIKKIIFHT